MARGKASSPPEPDELAQSGPPACSVRAGYRGGQHRPPGGVSPDAGARLPRRPSGGGDGAGGRAGLQPGGRLRHGRLALSPERRRNYFSRERSGALPRSSWRNAANYPRPPQPEEPADDERQPPIGQSKPGRTPALPARP